MVGGASGSLLERLTPVLASMGYELVDVEVSGRGHMRVTIDRAHEPAQSSDVHKSGITVEDCARVSNHLTRLFTVENVPYERLEVSSPGIDRPLKRLTDFERFRGERAQVRLRVLLDGRKRFEGVLAGVKQDKIMMDMDGALVGLPFADIEKAKLDPEWPVKRK